MADSAPLEMTMDAESPGEVTEMSNDVEKVITKEELELQKLHLEVQGLREKANWEKKKLKLEVTNLQHSFSRTLFTALLTAIISVTIAVGGWILQRRSEQTATKRAEQKHREEVYAKLLEDFGSANPAARMSAAVALGPFARPSEETANRTLAALISRLAIEDDLAVQEQIIYTISSLGKPALLGSATANRRAAIQFAHDSGYFVGLLISRNSVNNQNAQSVTSELESKAMNTLSLRFETVTFPLQQDYSRPFGRRLSVLRDILNGPLHSQFKVQTSAALESARPMKADKVAKETDAAWDALRRSTRIFVATSIALERELQSLSGNLRGANLDGIILLLGKLQKLDLKGISFQGSYLVADARESDLSFCDFTRANLEHMYLAKAILRGATLTKTIILGDALGDDDIADLTGANWWDSQERGEPPNGDLQTPQWLEKDFPRASGETERQKLWKDWESQNSH